MTPAGQAFASRVDTVTHLIRAGTPFFAAMAAGLKDDDWMLVYAAIRRMSEDIRHDNENEARNLASASGLPDDR